MKTRSCQTLLPGGVACGHAETSEHAPAAPGPATATCPRPCRIPGCPCRNFTPPDGVLEHANRARNPSEIRAEPGDRPDGEWAGLPAGGGVRQ